MIQDLDIGSVHYYSAEATATLAPNTLNSMFFFIYQKDIIKFNIVWYNSKYEKMLLPSKAQHFLLLFQLLTMALALGSNKDNWGNHGNSFPWIFKNMYNMYICQFSLKTKYFLLEMNLAPEPTSLICYLSMKSKW